MYIKVRHLIQRYLSEVVYNKEWMNQLINIMVLKGVSLVFLIVGCVSAISNDGFQQVIDSADNQALKNHLIAFQKEGIEFRVNTREYDEEKAIALAKSFLGTPHKMGGTTHKGMDCSGLVMTVHKKLSIQLPRSSHEQARYGIVIPQKEALERGDLVFFYNSYTTKNFITHSGIYLGDGNFIHTSTSKGVMISRLDDIYWGEKYLFATRLRD